MANLIRVSANSPCPVCRRLDWCLVSKDGSVALCPRVISDRDLGDAGYLHVLKPSNRRSANSISIAVPTNDTRSDRWSEFMSRSQNELNHDKLCKFAEELGVSEESLRRLEVGAHGNDGLTFPMKDEFNHVIGIRIRLSTGCKWSVKGSRNGIFIPTGESANGEQLVICEGPTDLAALLDLGFGSAVARPNCSGGSNILEKLVRIRRSREIVIIGDNDTQGIEGARKLGCLLALACSSVKVITPPSGIKDVRAWKLAGATQAALMSRIDSAISIQLSF